ncbi:TonB family protein [Halomonas sp. MCCC 1A11036]|uniref:TonB family protein n=1 Tax=Billgrantia zhangzhouensis TaxID=2733481 RepID=A0ABS9ACC5_9GAMM|nr:energy transducer TonB [Halomonas zhangzhouensis]MCE8018568.1 TonB family protein [Halomonas zhangzhouensis]
MAASISDSIRCAPVTRPYRRWSALLAALLLHLLLIGIVASWQFTPMPAERTSLDVVLVTRPAEAPVEAETIADTDQEAAGQETAETPGRSVPLDELPHLEAPDSSAAPAASAERPADEPEVAEEGPAEAAEESEAQPQAESQGTLPPEESLAESAANVPSTSGRDLLAQATGSIRQQLDANLAGEADDTPRSAAQRAAEARYIHDWTRRVEDYGNRVHPAPSHLHGQLRIRVVIGRDGQLRQAEVVQSSGHTELDQAALDTVHGAGPYRPFDSAMGGLDSLSITRVWRFGQGNHFGVR